MPLEIKNERMALDISTLLKLIPTFDTKENNQLYRFVRSCNSAFALASLEQESILLVYVLNNITGSGASDVHCKQYKTWIELRSFLIEKFSHVKTISHLSLELQSMFQKPNETMTEYFHRVDLCRSKIVEKLTAEILDETLAGRLATTEETALSVFINGINSDVGAMLRTKNFSNLSDAGRFALQEDKIRAMNNARQALFRVSAASRSVNSPRPHVKFTIDNRSMTRPPNIYQQNTSKTPPYQNVICNYCKKPGHLIADCRKRAYNNNIRNSLQEQNISPQQNFRALPAAKINNLNHLAASEASSSVETALTSCSPHQTQTSTQELNLEDLQIDS
ncbi:uncharacterized protein LOC128202226 [Galleria mellonella]|uniref:Uncharacterized protein LOC128200012 n=1 Tax=Galleria mellonella TaxID=7137 RepID=A0ABM3M8S8_GALME|nr:uncharacterized protein LOC128200012 [Galleria mellonella]XP_052749103.1 uncharacterized protein LOC128200262 [Galleria mellonella]XP_052757718.1 uncharacterized protein LOC128202226 [Galleria mellonella]